MRAGDTVGSPGAGGSVALGTAQTPRQLGGAAPAAGARGHLAGVGEGLCSALLLPTWGLGRAPQLCRGLQASGVRAGRLGAACCAAPGGVQPGSSASPEPHPSALQATKG